MFNIDTHELSVTARGEKKQETLCDADATQSKDMSSIYRNKKEGESERASSLLREERLREFCDKMSACLCLFSMQRKMRKESQSTWSKNERLSSITTDQSAQRNGSTQ